MLFSTPFSKGYWRAAAAELKDLRKLLFAALMIAACMILNKFKVPLGESLSLSVTFLARALCAAVCGPIVSIVFGAAEDTLGFFLGNSSGPYFPGYMITTITGCIIYAMFFYRARITVWRIIFAKLITNVQNVLLGSLWSAMLYSKGYIYYMTTSAWKNLLYFPVQVLLLVWVLQSLLPVMHRLRWSPCQLEGDRIPWR